MAKIQQYEERIETTPVCGCIKRDLYVSPKGIVMPCMPIAETSLEDKYPSMLKTQFEEILKDSYYSKSANATIKDLFDSNSKCKECKYRLECCGGCRGKAAQASPDNFFTAENELCEFYLDGWKNKLEKVAIESYNKFKSSKN